MSEVLNLEEVLPSEVYNVNVGVLGHIDSGKTTLARALSTVSSTASFDKSPQSQERGITLDLGFSAFRLPIPEHLRDNESARGHRALQITLVDCPGHASLLRTIIGGAQIIDLVVLVIDAQKGMQAQTAEGLVVAEIAAEKLIVAINKSDQVDLARVKKVEQGVSRVLAGTRFAGAPVVAVSARTGDNVTALADVVGSLVSPPSPRPAPGEEPFVLSIDHCFQIKGKGTIVTGTVLGGTVSVGDTLTFPSLGVERRCKSMQMFKKPVPQASRGDRVGLCVADLQAADLERGLAGSPGAVVTVRNVVAAIAPVKYHKQQVATGGKFHVTIGHSTVMAVATFFSGDTRDPSVPLDAQNETAEGDAGDGGPGVGKGPSAAAAAAGGDVMASLQDIGVHAPLDTDASYILRDELGKGAGSARFALLELETPVTCPPSSVLIASRLDADPTSRACRIAFFGRISLAFDVSAASSAESAKRQAGREAATSRGAAGKPEARSLVRVAHSMHAITAAGHRDVLRLYRWKERPGAVDRVLDDTEVIARGFLKKESDATPFVNMKVFTAAGIEGVVQGTFGKSGKVKIVFRCDHGLKPGNPLFIRFRRYIYDDRKRMIQDW